MTGKHIEYSLASVNMEGLWRDYAVSQDESRREGEGERGREKERKVEGGGGRGEGVRRKRERKREREGEESLGRVFSRHESVRRIFKAFPPSWRDSLPRSLTRLPPRAADGL